MSTVRAGRAHEGSHGAIEQLGLILTNERRMMSPTYGLGGEMDDVKWERWAAATGVLALALIAIEFIIVPTWPKADAPPTTIVDFFVEHRTAVLLGEYVGGIGGVVLLLWFLGSLRTFLMRAEGTPGRLSSVAFGSGLVAVAIGSSGAAINVVLASQVAEQGDEAVVSAFYTLANTAFAVFFLPIGAMIGATSIVALRTKALPVWYGVTGGVVAIGEIALAGTSTSISGPFSVTGALSSAALLLFGIWLATTSILLIQRVGRRSPARPM